MKDFLDGLKFWRRPLALIAIFGVSAYLTFTAPTAIVWGPALVIGVATGVLAGFDLHLHFAERFFQIKKLGPNADENYKRGLRRLKRQRRELVRKTFSYRNYGSGKMYLKEALELEERIEAHKNGEEYPPKASRVGRNSY